MHPYLRLRLRVRPSGRAESHAGPSLLAAPLVRRVLGKALIDAFCPFGEPRCQPAPGANPQNLGPRELCHLAECCPYGVLFAASRSPRPPFALYVPQDPSNGAGTLEMTLFGPAWKLYPWFLSGLASAFRTGLGKERRPWSIDVVTRIGADRREDRLLGDGDLARLSPALEPDLLGLAFEPCLAAQPVQVSLLSPARFLRDGKLLPEREPVPFDVLVGRILDRFEGLYGPGSSEMLRPEVRGVLEQEAARVPLLADETRWIEVPDYSARSRSEMLFGGKVGRLVYGPAAARFLPMLRVGEILHVGKNPTTGCGRIEADVLPATELSR